jgi:4-amino-4-deoxy-L-arabinose transferase-like glycosyltransferase
VLGRLVNLWLHDPTASYVALAVAFSGLTTFVVYYLARAVYDRTTALTAAALLAVSPLFWFYGSVGLTYAGEALFASTVAYFGFRALHGSRSDAYLAAWYLGIAGGMRQSLLVLLFPLWLACVTVGVRRVRVVLVGLGILTASVLTWFLPMIWLTGGLERYIAASVELADSVVKPTSIVGGPFEVTLRMSRYLLESVLVALGPLAAASILGIWYVRRWGWTFREWFLLGWTIPPVLVYTLVHFGQAGYVLRRSRCRTRGHAWRSRPRWSCWSCSSTGRSSCRRARRRAISTRRGPPGSARRKRKRSTGSSAGRRRRCASTRTS